MDLWLNAKLFRFIAEFLIPMLPMLIWLWMLQNALSLVGPKHRVLNEQP
jgi:hypothetical protein